MKFKKCFLTKVFALLLTILLATGQSTWGRAKAGVIENTQDHFDTALKDYQNGQYEQAAAKLEGLLKLQEEKDPEFIAKTYLLLGAGYERFDCDKAVSVDCCGWVPHPFHPTGYKTEGKSPAYAGSEMGFRIVKEN